MTDQASCTAGPAWLALLASDRVAAMREFLVTWYPGPSAIQPPAVDVPVALAEFYAVAAGRPQAFGAQNGIFPPARLRTDPDEGLLVFGAENQGNFTWMIDPTEADPVVWMVAERVSPVAERECLSGFLVQFCLFEAIFSAQSQAFSWSATATKTEQLTTSLQAVPLQPWHWPGDPTRFFVTADLVLCTCRNDDGFDILAGARSAEALSALPAAGIHWDHFTA